MSSPHTSLIRTIHHQIKQNHPLILNISNDVTLDFIANGLLSVGASPLMCTAVNEINELVAIADAVVINIGTLNDDFILLCHKACHAAVEYNKPLILDPVGAGASTYRTTVSIKLLETYPFQVVRGNAGEFMALHGAMNTTKGVDTRAALDDALTAGTSLSKRYHIICAISGPIDAVIFEDTITRLTHGSPLMPQITGSGCLLTAVIAAFSTQHDDAYQAVCAAVLFYGLCGEAAAQQAGGPGSFKVHFLDALSAT